jgi:glycosyltransferase involved in cell wall biosynthesis
MSMSRRIVVLNWRDPWHPKAGGAELVTKRIVERLVERDWSVEWFSSAYAGAAAREAVAGVEYRRAGSQLSCRLDAWRRYRSEPATTLFVDQVNTLPFYAHLRFRGPTIAFFHQLAREIWHYETRFPLSLAGYIAEPLYLLPYRTVPIVTVSNSTRDDFLAMGHKSWIHVIPEAVDVAALSAVGAARGQNVIALGRVVPSKRFDHAIRAAAHLRGLGWRGTLDIAGSGDEAYVAKLKALAARLSARVEFHGRVSEAQKVELLARSALIWVTSVREGWGLIVTEAARLAVPAVVYDVPGLRDAVIDGVTGRVVKAEPPALAAASATLLKSADLARYGANALREARTLSWERTADSFESALLRRLRPGA